MGATTGARTTVKAVCATCVRSVVFHEEQPDGTLIHVGRFQVYQRGAGPIAHEERTVVGKLVSWGEGRARRVLCREHAEEVMA